MTLSAADPVDARGFLDEAVDTVPFDVGRRAIFVRLASTVLVVNEIRRFVVRRLPAR